MSHNLSGKYPDLWHNALMHKARVNKPVIAAEQGLGQLIIAYLDPEGIWHQVDAPDLTDIVITHWYPIPLLPISQIRSLDALDRHWLPIKSFGIPADELFLVDGYDRKTGKRRGPRIAIAEETKFYIYDSSDISTFMITHMMFMPVADIPKMFVKIDYSLAPNVHVRITTKQLNKTLSAWTWLSKLLKKAPDDVDFRQILRAIKHGSYQSGALKSPAIVVRPISRRQQNIFAQEKFTSALGHIIINNSPLYDFALSYYCQGYIKSNNNP